MTTLGLLPPVVDENGDVLVDGGYVLGHSQPCLLLPFFDCLSALLVTFTGTLAALATNTSLLDPRLTTLFLLNRSYLNPVPVDVLRHVLSADIVIVVDVADDDYLAFRDLTPRDGGLGGWRLLWERAWPFFGLQRIGTFGAFPNLTHCFTECPPVITHTHYERLTLFFHNRRGIRRRVFPEVVRRAKRRVRGTERTRLVRDDTSNGRGKGTLYGKKERCSQKCRFARHAFGGNGIVCHRKYGSNARDDFLRLAPGRASARHVDAAVPGGEQGARD